MDEMEKCGHYLHWRTDLELANVFRLRNDGVPIVGFTWYSLTDQVDWDTCLRENNGRVAPRGLYDLDRQAHPVGKVYARLMRDWTQVLPAQSVCLQVPLVMPNEYAEPWAVRNRQTAHRPWGAGEEAAAYFGEM
ncbi:MAG: hypothetical protein V7642_6233 [Burkholderiales bacterium]